MSLIWFDGRIRSLQDTYIDPRDRGFLLGDGLFETMRLQAGRILHFDAHMHRLAEGADLTGIEAPGEDAISQAIEQLTGKLVLTDGVVRLTLTRGVGGRGLLPKVEFRSSMLITAQAGGFSTSEINVIISKTIRRDEHSPLCRIKNTNCLSTILARREAYQRGADDAIMLNTQQQIAESTVSNVIINDGVGLYTPPVSAGALPGIARKVLIESGLVERRNMTPKQLGCARGAWLINSLSVRTIITLDGKPMRQDREATNKIISHLAS